MLLLQIKRDQKGAGTGGWKWSFWHFRERITFFSIDFWEIRPSDSDGARRKAVLRREAYAWVPVLGVFKKLREVENFSYLGFTLC